MATKQNLYIDQGTTFTKNITVNNAANTASANLAGYSGRAQFRKEYTSNTYTSFDVSITANVGLVTIGLTSNVTSNTEYGRYVYDVEIVSNTGIVTRIVEGFMTITPEVTR